MELERWHKVDSILQAALALNPAERSGFIDSACEGDETLRDEVISLLSLEEQSFLLIDTPALEAAAPVLASARPDLFEGQSIGHYKILALLGIGGMGEVYLAEDTRLGRRIALKLLPADFTRDRDRVRRFQQEARAASALNHPYIVTIHETGEFEDRHFIATEFIEGETLRERLRRAPLTLGDTLDIAIQVAGALAAAHEAGIVHRDIKPENIMLRRDGYVKVVDFGLAKLAEQPPAGASCGLSADRTDTTTPGLLMGTVKYMSPEQARGRRLDGRSDVFSLGVVIYEMLAGRPPFVGDTYSDVIAALLKEQPVPLSQHFPELPVELENIANKALAKNREERYQTINDLLADLTELRRRLEVERTLGTIKPAESRVDSLRSPAHPSNGLTPVTVSSITQQIVETVIQNKLKVSVTLLIAAVATVGFFYSSKRPWRRTAAFQELRMTQLVESDKATFAAVSPDGKYVAQTIADGKTQSLVLRAISENTSRVLVPPLDYDWLRAVTFSRDGNYVYYGRWGKQDSTYALYRVPVSGGYSEKVLAKVESPITFSPEGTQFAFVRDISKEESGLFVANTDGAEEKLLASRRSPSAFSTTAGPSWSPDGRLIACAVLYPQSDQSPMYMNVAGISVTDGAEEQLTELKWFKVLSTAWMPDNSGFIMAATKKGEGALLWHVSYPEGYCRRITNDPSNFFGDYKSISLSADSSLLAVCRFEQRTNLWTAATGDPGQIEQITFGGKHRYLRVSWTSDGRIVFPSDVGGDRQIWIMNRDGSGQRQLTADGHNTLPSVSPDGRYVVYTSDSTGVGHIWRMNIDGSEPIQLTDGEGEFGPQCSTDGRWVLYMSGPSGKSTIWKVPIDGGEPVQFTTEPSAGPGVSPDGSLVACWWSPEKSPVKIAIIPFAGGEPLKYFDPVPGAGMPIRWTSDGRRLVYCVTRNDISNIWSQPLEGSPPKQLTDIKSEFIQGFDWSRDDRLLMSRGFTAREIVLIQDLNR
jgi:serine/threonine protein kinase/Tol biopolymer transport system component